MKIEKITENKKKFLDLLLLADEQENMIDKYLPVGDLFALYDDELKSVCGSHDILVGNKFLSINFRKSEQEKRDISYSSLCSSESLYFSVK